MGSSRAVSLVSGAVHSARDSRPRGEGRWSVRWPWQKEPEPVWPPQREYEWRFENGAAFGRVTSLNACIAHRDAFARDAVRATTKAEPGRACWLVVVATGERLAVVVLGDGSRQLWDSPDLPRFR